MKRARKLLVGLLCFAMLAGLLPMSISSGAQTPDQKQAPDQSQEVVSEIAAEPAELPEPVEKFTPADPVDPAKPVYPGEYYDYPITYDKDYDAWKEAGEVKNGGHGGWIRVCQIPEDILEILTTEQLLKTCLHYPLADELVCFDTTVIGLEFQSYFFNGLGELLKRNDFSKTLANYYASLTEEDLGVINGEVVRDVIIYGFFDKYFVETCYLESLTCLAVDKGLLLPEDCAVIAESHERLSKVFEIRDDGFTSYLAKEIAVATQKEAKKINSIASPQYDGTWQGYRFNLTTVKTPKNSEVEALQFIDELNDKHYQVAMTEANKWKALYPDDTKILKEPTIKYNCHSYVWHGYSSTNPLWLNLSSAIVYMTDTSYLPQGMYSESDDYPSGTTGKIFYQTMVGTSYIHDHSANLYHGSKKMVRSKWGYGCLMQHEQSHCPYYVDGITKFVLYDINPDLYIP